MGANDLIPKASFEGLEQAAKTRSGAHAAAEHMSEIQRLLNEVLPRLEALLERATGGPEPLDAASRNLVLAGGKRVRPLSALLVQRAAGGAGGQGIVELAAAAELIHSATLMHDDVIDEGEERRGRKTSRVLWGNLVSVLAGDLLLTSALRLVQQSGVRGAMEDTLATMQALIAGEVAQLKARGRDDIGIDGYLEIAQGKTASLFSCACRFGARSAGASDAVIDAVGRFGERVGIAFQIVDDVLDLEGVPHEVGKQLGHDLAEGKTTLPLALALRGAREQLRPLLIDARAGDTVAAAKVSQAEPVRAACAEARAYAMAETEKGLRELAALPESRERVLLQAMVQGLIDRRT